MNCERAELTDCKVTCSANEHLLLLHQNKLTDDFYKRKGFPRLQTNNQYLFGLLVRKNTHSRRPVNTRNLVRSERKFHRPLLTVIQCSIKPLDRRFLHCLIYRFQRQAIERSHRRRLQSEQHFHQVDVERLPSSLFVRVTVGDGDLSEHYSSDVAKRRFHSVWRRRPLAPVSSLHKRVTCLSKVPLFASFKLTVRVSQSIASIR